MISLKRVALATSGTISGVSAESSAFNYCRENTIDELLVIHVLETSLRRFGENDQLATGCCKADFIQYINNGAQERSASLYDRLNKKSTLSDVSYRWVVREGDPFKEISTIVNAENISILFIGEGEPTESFFSPPKYLAKKLVKYCNCKVVISPYQEPENCS